MKKLMYAITIGAITTALLFPTTAVTAITKSVRVTGKSVIYDKCYSRYIIFFTDNNNHEYIYQVKGKQNNKTMQMFKKSFVNKSVNAKINNKKQIISNLIP